MHSPRRQFLGMAAGAAGASLLAGPGVAFAKDTLVADSEAALAKLVASNHTAAILKGKAKGILVFPKIVKAGLVVGGSVGKGILKKNGKVDGRYTSVSGSIGFQAGAQAYGYALFCMTAKALDYLYASKGWEVGVGPTVVVVDEGVAKNLTTATLQDDAYAFIFNQAGLMAGVSLEGTKITKSK